MKGFHSNIETDTIENNNFRKVLYSAKHLQLVLMSLKVGEEIGEEVHYDNDQFFRFESGFGKCIVEGNEYSVKDGDVLIVPAGANHNVINTDGEQELKLYTIYAPSHHKDGIVRATKEEAEQNDEDFDGVTTEKSIDKPNVIDETGNDAADSSSENGDSRKAEKINKKIDKYQQKMAKLKRKLEKLTGSTA
ncbi:MAG: cupin domain-containing protein [Pyrinomonadaceae bacterium]|nr:cupin domain-containing protein [Pyrinomonadaceae bacterium]